MKIKDKYAMDQIQLMEEAQTTVKNKRKYRLWQDIGMFLFLVGLLASCGVVIAGGEAMLLENVIMFLTMVVGLILIAFHFRFIAVAYGALITAVYAVVKVVSYFIYDKEVVLLNFAWLVLPLVTILAFHAFMRDAYQSQLLSELLINQIEAMEAVDPVTGLFNRKSMYSDLERQMAYARRNNIPLSLLIVTLKYSDELKEILTKSQFGELKVRFADITEDVARIEDRVFAIGEDGEIGIITLSNREGTAVLGRRLREKCLERDAFDGIMNQAIKVELKMGILEYDPEKYTNSIDFTKQTENELQYDV